MDAHSVIINPNFTNTTDLIPSVRMDYGTNLGSLWSTGLSLSATWTVGASPQTQTQGDTWQVGSRVFASAVIPTPSKGVIKDEGRYVIYNDKIIRVK